MHPGRTSPRRLARSAAWLAAAPASTRSQFAAGMGIVHGF